MTAVSRTSIALQKDTKIELDMIKAQLQIPHDDVVKMLIKAWVKKKEVEIKK